MRLPSRTRVQIACFRGDRSGRNSRVPPTSASGAQPPVHTTNSERALGVDLTRSPSRRRTAGICAKRKFYPSVISRVPNPLGATDETVSPTALISCVVQSTKYSCEVAFFCLPDLPSQKIVMLPLQFLGKSRGRSRREFRLKLSCQHRGSRRDRLAAILALCNP